MADELLEREILDEVIARIEEFGLAADSRPGEGRDADALITIAMDGRSLTLHAWIKLVSGPAALVADVLRRIRPQGDGVLVTEYVSPRVADRLRDEEVQFLDTAGNMYVRQDGVVLWVAGRRQRERTVRERPVRAFRRAGLQVVFTLLADPDLVRAPYRVIAHRAATSLGAVTPVIQDLRLLGYVVGPEEHRSMQRLDRLLTTWAEGYAHTLRPRLHMGRFRADDPRWRESIAPGHDDIAWGSATAASILTQDLTPRATTVYADSPPENLIRAAGLHRDPEGSIEIRRRFWAGPLPAPRPDVVPAPLIYADLVADDDARSTRAARQIRADYLDRSHSGPAKA
ncbi:type IV toxin-antitoxin system AbiEi family antitoxin [Jiangella mangrovi]|uniref:Uncharacterized protein n=1 Tax=Jiangella mangrovi TaxID=1524084 RepID=A0A7W9GVI6_9ACTN|nr:type IV toxin-antitoxin system AbiEi family antitoxin [Jiangella mangrovi]MBB5790584.1 hypothetical protein [Jiangella mangrovi]